jgi:hypothetical protein
MPGNSTVQRGNELFAQILYQSALAVPNLPASSTVLSTYTIAGAQIGDLISYNQLSYVSGVSADNMYVSAANTLSVYWTNNTASAINGTAAQPFIIEFTRPENMVEGGFAMLPTTIF